MDRDRIISHTTKLVTDSRVAIFWLARPSSFRKNINRNNKLGQKKVVLFPEIGRMKIFYHSPARLIECVSKYTVLIWKKQQTNSTNKKSINQKKQKKITKEKKRTSPENWLKEINLQPPGSRFFSSPAFPERKVLFFWPCKDKKGKSSHM